MCHRKQRKVTQEERSESQNVGVKIVPYQFSGIKVTVIARIILFLRNSRDPWQ